MRRSSAAPLPRSALRTGELRDSLVHFAFRVVFPACCFSTDWRHFSTRNRMAIQKVGVVGCGLMGSGIAQVCAQTGFLTVVREVSAEIVEKGLKNIEKNLRAHLAHHRRESRLRAHLRNPR